MSVIELSRENFDAMVTGQPMVLVDFWAHWCGPCRVFDPVYRRVSEKHPNITFAKVNVEQEPELAEDFNVRSIPMLMIFREGIAIYAESGALTEPALEDIIQQAQMIDLSEVKKTIAERGAKSSEDSQAQDE